MEEEEGHRGCRGGLTLGAPSARAEAGDGACPCDRCCPDLVEARVGGSRRNGKKEIFRGARKDKKGRLAGSRVKSSTDEVSKAENAAEEGVPQSISFRHLAASMPRWILKTKTKFAAYLSKTFHLQCGGSAPSSVVFPLPLPELCLFRGGGPKLSKRRWQTLLRKRLLHLVVVALNYLHDGFHESDIWQLGRRPNDLQKKIHHRLWSLLTTCDAPGMFPLSPGRSGDEFIARLRSLEVFAKSCPLLSAEMYEEGPDDLSKKKRPEVCRSYGGPTADEGESLGLGTYRPLDVSRLKLTGRGQWDLASHLHDELWLPYVEPAILRHGLKRPGVEGPNLAREDRSENLKLAKLWSSQGLLCLAHQQPSDGMVARVFNNLKNEQFDRQIGDRRLMNGGERSIQGPSRYLPGGYLMTSLHCEPGCRLVGAVTDRKDFYHQSKVTRQRAESNCLPFGYSISDFEGDPALDDLRSYTQSLSGGREKVGDRYGGKPRSLLSDNELVYPCFASLFQGDHLGVEFALSSHSSMLESVNLLRPSSRILGRCHFPVGPVWEGLVIDDYFAIAAHHVSDTSPPFSLQCFEAAIRKYDEEGVLGSPEKDVYNSDHFKVVGAEVNSSEQARSRGVVGVASPATKRLSLIALSLRAACLPVISRGLASRLAGCWTCTLLFRRCLASVLSELYSLGVIDGKSEDEILAFNRRAAGEITVASVLALVASTNVQVPYLTKIFATDASMRKGAVVSREVDAGLAKCVWLGGDKKGAYTKLDNPFSAALKGLGVDEEGPFDDDASLDDKGAGLLGSPSRFAFEFSFDFCEICGGSGVVSAAAARLGMIVCPPIELSDSPHFDLKEPRLIEWICFMLQTGKIRSIMLEPPCTSFSAAAHPAVRSYREPLGFDRLCPKTWLGNLLAFRCFILMLVAYHYDRPNLLEQPFLSKMAWLSIWRFLLKKGFNEASVASCAFGSPHLKKFRLLCFGLDAEELTVPCRGGHRHLRIEGKYTRPSAVYVPRLAEHFAKAFFNAVQARTVLEEDEGNCVGVESVVSNDILMTGEWSLELQWFWKSTSHINILESHALLALLRRLTIAGGDCRFSVLIDSRVAKCAHAKGRSSSRALLPSLRKAAALQVAGGLYASYSFAPTRLNIADDPTRDAELRPSSKRSCLDGLPPAAVQALNSFNFSGPYAGWIRLCLLLGIFPRSTAHDLCAPASSSPTNLAPAWIYVHIAIISIFFVVWTFASRSSLSHLTDPKHPKVFRGKQLHQYSRCPMFLLMFARGAAMDTGASTGADRLRAARRAGTQLFTDRVMRPETRRKRDVLLEKFDSWCITEFGESILRILEAEMINPERVGQMLVGYGRMLYYAGKPYGSYSETINAVVSKRGSLRRQLGVAWDLAFSWVADEPGSHHPAMPRAVLLSISALAMLWGWPTEAAIFLLCWTGLMRIGEVLLAKRRDVILPKDGAPGFRCILVRITTPKTRGRAARHQSARIDQADVVDYLSAVFAKLAPDQPLWSMSSSTLRKRMNMLQASLGLPTSKSHEVCPYDLGSFRPGGATDMLQQFEDSELVRRRGRWVSTKVLEVYLQEVSTATFQTKLSEGTKSKLERLTAAFTQIRVECQYFLDNDIPVLAWKHLWSTQA